MTLQTLLHGALARLNAAGTPDDKPLFINFGFATADPAPEFWTFREDSGGQYELESGLQDAFIVLQAPPTVFADLFTLAPDADTGAVADTAIIADVIRQITILPHDYARETAQFVARLTGLPMDAALFESPGVFPLPLAHPSGENLFRIRSYNPQPLPEYDSALLPELVADDHPEWVEMYNAAWQMAFQHFRQPEPESGFPYSFIDTAFNKNTFMWDSCFMMMFGAYARRVFDFMGTLDNFYAKQHADGFICREISTYTGQDLFNPGDPRSTGPNILAWTEWLNYQHTGDVERLRAVFPALMAYHRWWRNNRSWPDGGYWTSSLGSGMDNQTRVPDVGWRPDAWWHHAHYHHTWVDATMQQALSCAALLHISTFIERKDFEAELEHEYNRLTAYVNYYLWDEESGFYYDRAPDGQLSTVKTIGAYWGLLAGVVPGDRAQRILKHLDDPALFNRPHRVPSQAADSSGYAVDGDYWRGGVWPPTNYMLLKALTTPVKPFHQKSMADNNLAFEIALNHVENVVQVFAETGTFWENYAPESAAPGGRSKPDFIGWTGVSAINIPLEYVIGIKQGVGFHGIEWDVRLTERHGVYRYPIGDGTANLICEARSDMNTCPVISVETDTGFRLFITWEYRVYDYRIEPGSHRLDLSNEEENHEY